MEFNRQEYWSGVPFPTPENLPNPEIETASLAPPAMADRSLTTAPPGKPTPPTAYAAFIVYRASARSTPLFVTTPFN